MQPTSTPLFSRTVGLPLTKTTRNGLVQYFHFGRAHHTTPQGLILDIGEVTLALQCPWQLQLADGGVIRHSDVYIRKREAGLPAPVWDWKVPGSSFRDQRLLDLVKQAPPLVVARLEQLGNGGMQVTFSDHSTLTASPSPEEPTPIYWELFSNTGDGMKASAGGQE